MVFVDMQNVDDDDGGIYEIECFDSGRRYIGSTTSFVNRYRAHFTLLKSSRHDNKALMKDVERFGLVNFEFRVVERLIDTSKQNLELHEALWQNEFKPAELYNSLIGVVSYNRTMQANYKASMRPKKQNIPSIDDIKAQIFGYTWQSLPLTQSSPTRQKSF